VKDYYVTLKISRHANATEIKKAYRRLAVQFHPDKNPNPSAEQIFKEVNEAYEVLGDAVSKARYDSQLDNPFTTATKENTRPAHRDPAYRRKKPHVLVKSDRERMLEMMLQYLPWANRMVYVAFGVCFLLALDFTLPTNKTSTVIVDTRVERTYSKNTSSWWVMNTETAGVVRIPYSYADDFKAGRPIYVITSSILGIPLRVSSTTANVYMQKSIYGSFSFAPLALFLTSCFGIYYRRRIDYGFNAGVVSFMLLILTGIIYALIHL
jgi:hypothetical protein